MRYGMVKNLAFSIQPDARDNVHVWPAYCFTVFSVFLFPVDVSGIFHATD